MDEPSSQAMVQAQPASDIAPRIVYEDEIEEAFELQLAPRESSLRRASSERHNAVQTEGAESEDIQDEDEDEDAEVDIVVSGKRPSSTARRPGSPDSPSHVAQVRR